MKSLYVCDKLTPFYANYFYFWLDAKWQENCYLGYLSIKKQEEECF